MKLKVLFYFTNGYTGSRISFIYIARFIDLLKKVTPYIFLYIVIVLTHRAMFYLAKKNKIEIIFRRDGRVVDGSGLENRYSS